MKLKTIDVNGTTYAVVADGKPVYVHEDGKEQSFDAPQAVSKITQLNGEAQRHRESREAAENKLKAFAGIEDPEAAIKALDTIKNIDEGKLVAAGKVDEIKTAAQRAAEESVAAARKAHDEALRTAQAERDTYRTMLHGEKIGNAFARSSFISSKVATPVDMIQAMFGGRFKVQDDGKIVATGADGQPIPSREKFGEPAGFEEAIEALINDYPHRDSILKGTGAAGSGARPGNGSGGGSKTVTRTEFDGLSHSERASKVRDGFKVVDD